MEDSALSSKTATLSIRVAVAAQAAVASIIKTIIEASEKHQEDKLLARIAKAANDPSNLNVRTCEGINAISLHRTLTNANVPHAFLESKDGTLMFVTRNEDSERVANALDMFTKDNRVAKSELGNEGNPLVAVNNLNKFDVQNLDNFLKENGIAFNYFVENNGNDTVNLVFDSKNLAVANNAVLAMTLMSSGSYGEMQRREFENSRTANKEVIAAINSPQKEIYCVGVYEKSGTVGYMHINEDGCSIHKEGVAEQFISRDDGNFAEKVYAETKAFDAKMITDKSGIETSNLATFKQQHFNPPQEIQNEKKIIETTVSDLANGKESADSLIAKSDNPEVVNVAIAEYGGYDIDVRTDIERDTRTNEITERGYEAGRQEESSTERNEGLSSPPINF